MDHKWAEDYDSDVVDASEDDDDDDDGVSDANDACPKGDLAWGPSAPAVDFDGDGCQDGEDTR